jgi:hypothetical protein
MGGHVHEWGAEMGRRLCALQQSMAKPFFVPHYSHHHHLPLRILILLPRSSSPNPYRTYSIFKLCSTSTIPTSTLNREEGFVFFSTIHRRTKQNAKGSASIFPTMAQNQSSINQQPSNSTIHNGESFQPAVGRFQLPSSTLPDDKIPA